MWLHATLCWLWLYLIFLQLIINVHTLIYCENIKGFIDLFFVVTFRHLVILFFKKKPFVLVLIFSTTFSPFFIFQKICHSYPLQPIFLKLQLEFQTSYINLKSIHISILKLFVLKWKIYTLISNIFIWMWKFISQF